MKTLDMRLQNIGLTKLPKQALIPTSESDLDLTFLKEVINEYAQGIDKSSLVISVKKAERADKGPTLYIADFYKEE